MNYTMRTAGLNNMLLKNLWNDKRDWFNIKLLATALTSACPTERLEDTLQLSSWEMPWTNKKIMDGLAKWNLTIDHLALLTNMKVKTYNLTYLGQYDFLMA